jgi:phospholipid/cholesterol/gamma-HCH transport system ATP-binding protein
MIRIEDISTDGFSSLFLEAGAGDVCKIIMDSEYDKDVFLETVLARREPRSGKVYLFGQDLYSLSGAESVKIFMKVGMVWRDGGVISNLKVWENILLPAWYHRGLGAGDIEDHVIEFFGRMGKDASGLHEHMGKLPGTLPEHEKRLVGLARAVFMEPKLMIYDSVFEGVGPEMENRLLEFTSEFHSERPGRTSLYVTSVEHSLDRVEADTVFRQKGRGFKP